MTIYPIYIYYTMLTHYYARKNLVIYFTPQSKNNLVTVVLDIRPNTL